MQIIEEKENKTRWSDAAISALIINLIVEINKLYSPMETFSSSETKNDLNDSRARLLDELFYKECDKGTLESFAKSLGVCTRQVQRLVKEYYGTTFKKKRSDARMAKAATIIEDNKISIDECIQLCGYSSSTAFNKAFKDKFGITPKQYQEKHTDNNFHCK